MSVDASQRVKHIGLNPTDLSRILGKVRAAPHVYDFHASVAFRHDASVRDFDNIVFCDIFFVSYYKSRTKC